MSVTADLAAVLAANSNVANRCAANTKTRSKAIRPETLAQADVLTGSLGGLEITTTGRDSANTLDGGGNQSIVRTSIDCLALSSQSANDLADAVEAAIGDYSGLTAGGKIEDVILDDRSEQWEIAEDGRETGRYIVTVTAQVFYKKT